MEPLKIYNYLVLARQRVLDRVRSLGAEQYAQQFPIGLGSLDRTLTHIMTSEWYYVQRMRGRDVPPDEQWTIRWEDPPPFAVLEAAWIKQTDDTRSALGTVRDWLEPIEYRVTDDDGKRMIVTASAIDIFTQLAFHEVHHRAQVINMLTHLGAGLGDIDFNTLMYQRRRHHRQAACSIPRVGQISCNGRRHDPIARIVSNCCASSRCRRMKTM